MYKIASRNAQLRAGRINWQEIAASQEEDLQSVARLLVFFSEIDDAEMAAALDEAQTEANLWQHRLNFSKENRAEIQAALGRAANIRNNIVKAIRIKQANARDRVIAGIVKKAIRERFGEAFCADLYTTAEEVADGVRSVDDVQRLLSRKKDAAA